MSMDDRKIITQPDQRWRVIPGFPDYEMNMLEEVRHVAKKRAKWEQPQDGRFIRIWHNGRMQSIGALTLAKKTFPELYGRNETDGSAGMKSVERL